jgi:hypothetical protein
MDTFLDWGGICIDVLFCIGLLIWSGWRQWNYVVCLRSRDGSDAYQKARNYLLVMPWSVCLLMTSLAVLATVACDVFGRPDWIPSDFSYDPIRAVLTVAFEGIVFAVSALFSALLLGVTVVWWLTANLLHMQPPLKPLVTVLLDHVVSHSWQSIQWMHAVLTLSYNVLAVFKVPVADLAQRAAAALRDGS